MAGAASAGRSITVGGAFSKNHMGGPVRHTDVVISTSGLKRVLQYEPRDLTISVEAGLPFAELERIAAAEGQMAPLDPPYHYAATVGGVVAANCSGPRRRLYGTARDMVIGMQFATLEGKLVSTGGMVVKNAAGLDLAKLMVGSFGTLAAISVVNFKLVPLPEETSTWVASFGELSEAFSVRDRILKSVLQPDALDLLNPHAAGRLDLEGYVLLMQGSGSKRVLTRYGEALPSATRLAGKEEASLWEQVREFVPHFLREHEAGAVLRISSSLQDLKEIMGTLPVPGVARAGNGVTQACFPDCDSAAHWLKDALANGVQAVIESVPAGGCPASEQWPSPGSDLTIMRRIKALFDPGYLLNRGRLYGRI